MLYKKTILTKFLSNGMKADFAVVMEDGLYKAALYINGRFVRGPAMPEPLSEPNDTITHWMGNKPGVGLTTEEAERITREVTLENSVVKHRIKSL